MAVPRSGFDDLSVDYVEFYVADAGASAADLADRYDFEMFGAYQTGAHQTGGPQTGGHRSVALRQANIVLVLTEGIDEQHPATAYVQTHGDGVANIALRTSDARAAFTQAVGRGARPIVEPTTWGDSSEFVTASIRAFGDVTHTFVQYPDGQAGAGAHRRLPGFTPTDRRTLLSDPAPAATSATAHDAAVPTTALHAAVPTAALHTAVPTAAPNASVPTPPSTRLDDIDHFAVCLETGGLDPTVEFYTSVLDFSVIYEERIAVGRQAMLSSVVQSTSGMVTLTLIQPDPTAEAGQIDDFLKDHGGPGIQHMAFRTTGIVSSVSALASRGVEFLTTPSAYYRLLADRLDLIKYTVDDLRAQHILVDEDHDGQMFQIFTKSVHPRRTMFFEVIERLGAKTFGSGNIKALYEAVEAERIRPHDFV